jgi:peptidoglycan/xylan/chitin deacetylase (PgdA/CDA1 family)
MSRVLALLFHDVYYATPEESGFPGPAAARYKIAAPVFDAHLAAIAGVRRDAPVLLRSRPAEGAMPFAITVDDGGESFYTVVAERLEQRGWRAHCFVTTDYIGRPGFLERRQIVELHARGHLIGTHSASHPMRLRACGWERMVREWSESRDALSNLLGVPTTVASVPAGAVSTRVVEAAHHAGLRVLFTSDPDTRVREVAGCTVAGRFTVRRGHAPRFTAEVAALRPGILARERGLWTLKQAVKRALDVVRSRPMDTVSSGAGR